MILIFDLDDTIYDELTYVRSGFRAVAAWGAHQLGIDADASYETLNQLLQRDGRGYLFNRWLDGRGSVREAIRVYRHHTPAIHPWDAALRALEHLSDRALYLVTDGHKIVQAKKLAALGIEARFRQVFITHRYGVTHAKPSTHCFELIRKREKCEWPQMVYVGDNPEKDFVNLTPLGMQTIRVLTGQHREIVAKEGYEAKYRIASLDELPSLLNTLRA